MIMIMIYELLQNVGGQNFRLKFLLIAVLV